MASSQYTLLADRFLQPPAGPTIDLATGEQVWIRITHEVPVNDEWTDRCAALYLRRHPHVVELVDYGALGRRSRFEAFRTHGSIRRWSGGDRAAAQALDSAATFLAGQGLSAGKPDRGRVIDVGGEPRLLADEATGLRLDAGGTPVPIAGQPSAPSQPESRAPGIVLQPRLAVGQVLDFLEEPWPRDARWLQLRAPAGSGASTTLRLVAREVRLRGFVPVGTALFASVRGNGCEHEVLDHVATECAGRHVVLLHDRSDDSVSAGQDATRIAQCIFRLCGVARWPHIAIVSVAGPTNRPTMPWVALEPLTSNQLRAAVGADVSARYDDPNLMRAIRASCGWPARFLRSLGVWEASHHPAAVARERAPRFTPRTEDRASDITPTSGAPNAAAGLGTPSGADLDGWKRLMEARGLVRRGRHAAATRTFREAVGMFERRGDQLHAGTAWYELGQLCLLRGAVDVAQRAFDQAGQRFRAGGAALRAITATVGEGLAKMEAGHLREAETMLRTSALPIGQIRDSSEGVLVRTALIRCLSWQGRLDEAVALIARDTYHCAEWHAAAARVALQRGALGEAAGHVNAAIAATREDQPFAACLAQTAAVGLHGCIGDAEAVRLHAARALDAARAAHAPLEAIRLRVSLVIALNQAGAPSEARPLAMRLLRLRHLKIPALLNAELGTALSSTLPEVAAARSRGAQAEAFARAAGAVGLLPVTAAAHGVPPPLSDIIDVLRSAEEYEDETVLLERVGQLLRTRLGALSAAFVPAEDPETTLVVAGSAPGVAAARALTAGVLIGPLRTSAGIEIAAPIRCGGAMVGVLGCRWSVAGPDNADHARALIATTAVVSGSFFKAVLDRRRAQPLADDCPELVGVSAAMTDLRRAIARAAAAPFPVLVVGESGVGKELVARAIHRASPRRLRNFAALNCAALTEELVETELFGHARGAFTGAVADRRGIFEEADGGTLFLDEVSELSPRAQAKLLRVLQEGEVRRVGESFARRIDVRVIAATNRTVEGPPADRQFRQDLRYRLDVIRIEVPPLRHRIDDVPALTAVFWGRVAPLIGCRATLSASTIAAFARYDWPGNVRELQNVISALVVAAPRRGVVRPCALPAAIVQSVTVTTPTTLDAARLTFERRFVTAAMARAGGRYGQAARDLGITRQGLAKLMKRLGIQGIQKTEDRRQNKTTGENSGNS
jgi:DNA-binding NtrC family response regulator